MTIVAAKTARDLGWELQHIIDDLEFGSWDSDKMARLRRIREEVAEYDRARRQPAQESAVPKGYVLTPYEPTLDQFLAGDDCRKDGGSSCEVYQAMLDAAPVATAIPIDTIRKCVANVRKWYAEDIFTEGHQVGRIARLTCDNILREIEEAPFPPSTPATPSTDTREEGSVALAAAGKEEGHG